ncbi:MAG: SdpI family protein [Bacteroidia bacterium]
MKNIKAKEGIIFLIALVPLAYLAFVWAELPEVVPVHYNIEGKVDRMGSKLGLAFPIVLLSFGVYALLKFIPLLDPRQKSEFLENDKFINFRFLLQICMSLLAMGILYQTLNVEFQFITTFIPVLLFGLFAILGNFMTTVRSNYFIGIRTPWTLENETVWKKTHDLGGKLWLYGGIIGMLLSLILPSNLSAFFMIALLCIMSIIPIVYSYFIYRKEVQHK